MTDTLTVGQRLGKYWKGYHNLPLKKGKSLISPIIVGTNGSTIFTGSLKHNCTVRNRDSVKRKIKLRGGKL